LKQCIIDNEIGSMTSPDEGDSWPLFLNYLPDGDDVETNCGAIYDTAGLNELRSMNGDIPEHPGVQIRIRSNDCDIAYAKIEDITRDLDKIVNASVSLGDNQYQIQNASRTSPIIPLGIEIGTTKRRFSFTVNYLLTIRKTN
jgi:hypothetical protein